MLVEAIYLEIISIENIDFIRSVDFYENDGLLDNMSLERLRYALRVI